MCIFVYQDIHSWPTLSFIQILSFLLFKEESLRLNNFSFAHGRSYYSRRSIHTSRSAGALHPIDFRRRVFKVSYVSRLIRELGPPPLPSPILSERKTHRLKAVSVAISVLIEVLNSTTRLSVSLSKYWISTDLFETYRELGVYHRSIRKYIQTRSELQDHNCCPATKMNL